MIHTSPSMFPDDTRMALWAADTILVIHAAYIGFVVVGLFVVVLGGFLRWRWIRQPVFRWLHLAAMAVVVVQSFLGLTCPLTLWEDTLRRGVGRDGVSAQGFVAHWLHRLIFFEADPAVFTAIYTGFFLLFLAAWWKFPPRPLFISPAARCDGGAGNGSVPPTRPPRVAARE